MHWLRQTFSLLLVVWLVGCAGGENPVQPDPDVSTGLDAGIDDAPGIPDQQGSGDLGASEASVADAGADAGADARPPAWPVVPIGGPGNEDPVATARDAQGNLYLAGYFTHTFDLDGETLTVTDQPDVWVASYDGDGHLRWAKAFGGPGSDFATDIAVDAAGRVTVVGRFRQTLTVGNDTLSAHDSGAFVIGLAGADGALRWVKAFDAQDVPDSSLGEFVTISDLAVSADGAVYLVGSFAGLDVDFGGGPVDEEDYRGFFVSFEADGTFRWSRPFGRCGMNVMPWGVDVDGQGRVTICGTLGALCGDDPDAPVDYGDGEETPTRMFIARYTADNGYLWHTRFDDLLGASCLLGVQRTTGEVNLVSQVFGSQVDFGGGPLLPEDAAAAMRWFATGFDAQGGHVWSKHVGIVEQGENDGAGVAVVVVDADNNAHIVGGFVGTVAFAGQDYTSGGALDGFIATYDDQGAETLLTQFGGSGDDLGRGLLFDGSGARFVVGAYQETIEIGGGLLTSQALTDAFILREGP